MHKFLEVSEAATVDGICTDPEMISQFPNPNHQTSEPFGVLHLVSIKDGLRDFGLWTTDYGLGIKYGLGVKRGLENMDWV